MIFTQRLVAAAGFAPAFFWA